MNGSSIKFEQLPLMVLARLLATGIKFAHYVAFIQYT